MKEDSVGVRIWKIIYPVLIHFGVMFVVQFCMIVFLIVQSMAGGLDTTAESFSTELTGKFYAISGVSVLVTAIITIPILYLFYARDKSQLPAVTNHYSKAWFIIVIVLGISSCLSINYLLSLSGIMEIFSQDMELINESLYSTPVLFQVISMGLIAPVAEELVFRGLIFKRVRTYSNFVTAAFVASIIFGIYHGNVVQGIYAFIVGFLMCFVYERFRNIWAPILFHCSANTVSVLITYLSSGLEETEGNIIGIIAVMAVSYIIAILCIIIIKVKIRPERRETLIDQNINNSDSML